MSRKQEGSRGDWWLRTPCIGLCSTTYGDSVCRGCRRFGHEVVNWNRYSAEEKRAVWTRLEAFRDRIVQGRLHVFDAELLALQLQRHRIPFRERDSDAARAYLLLRRGARHIRDLNAYGIEVVAELAHLDPVALLDLVDQDFQALSEAHYLRYFPAESRQFG